MGGCCCCSSRSADLSRAPAYFYYPEDLEENEQLVSTTHDTPSAVSTGVLVDTNLDTSPLDTFQAPPSPLPFNIDSRTMVEADGILEVSDIHRAHIGSEKRSPNKSDCQHDSIPLVKDAIEKPIAVTSDEDDGCPICLEGYDLENPQILTRCGHHFHLACIFEWQERSDACAICGQVMEIDPMYGQL